MRSDTIILADGTKKAAQVGLADGVLWVYFLDGTSIVRAAELLGNKKKTEKITYIRAGEEITYEGYTSVVRIQYDPEGRVNIALTKE